MQELMFQKAKEKSNVEPFKTRFSVHTICELLSTFSDDQKLWIQEADLGSLHTISEFQIPVNLVAWIMGHINPLLGEFRIKNKLLVFDKHLVCNILSVPNGSNPVKVTCTANEYDAFQKICDQFMDGCKAKMMKCIQVLKAATEDKVTFMRVLMLLALGYVLFPGIDNAVSTRYLHDIVDISQIKSFD